MSMKVTNGDMSAARSPSSSDWLDESPTQEESSGSSGLEDWGAFQDCFEDWSESRLTSGSGSNAAKLYGRESPPPT